MFRLIFVACLMMFLSAYTDSCGQLYEVTHGCDHTYGNVIDTQIAASFIPHCLLYCNGNYQCVTVKYDEVNKVCQLNSDRYLTLSTDCPTTLNYANLTTRFCHKLINDYCNVTDDCSVPNSQCLLNKCRCDPGYSFNYPNESCIPSCDIYGSTFTEYPGYRLKYHDTRTVLNVSNSEVCQQACAEEITFVCRSFDYWPVSHTCYLSVDTALTKPAYYLPGNGYYYNRNCQ